MTQEKPSFAQLEKEGWRDPATAQSYARDFAHASAYAVPALVRSVGAGPGCRALDLCCGHGIVAAALADAGAEVVALDFSTAMLEMARARVPHATFVEGDAMALPFEDDAFDAVTIGFGIPHVPDPPRVFAEAKRCLRPGGRLAYSVWADEAGAMREVFGAIAQFGAPGIALPSGPGAQDYAEIARATKSLGAAGFDQILFTSIACRWRVDDPGLIVDFFEQGTVRGGALLRSQPEHARRAIREAVMERVRANWGGGPEWDVPIPAVVVSAVACVSPPA